MDRLGDKVEARARLRRQAEEAGAVMLDGGGKSSVENQVPVGFASRAVPGKGVTLFDEFFCVRGESTASIGTPEELCKIRRSRWLTEVRTRRTCIQDLHKDRGVRIPGLEGVVNALLETGSMTEWSSIPKDIDEAIFPLFPVRGLVASLLAAGSMQGWRQT